MLDFFVRLAIAGSIAGVVAIVKAGGEAVSVALGASFLGDTAGFFTSAQTVGSEATDRPGLDFGVNASCFGKVWESAADVGDRAER